MGERRWREARERGDCQRQRRRQQLMSRLVPSLAAAFASGRMLCCAASTSLVTDGPTSGLFGLFGSVRASLAATASCSRPTWALKNADTRLSMPQGYAGGVDRAYPAVAGCRHALLVIR